MPKLVNIRLFKDNRNYAGDVFVSVNGESYLIQRGVTVAVPEYIAEVLESSQREDENAALRMERAERSYMPRSCSSAFSAAIRRAARRLWAITMARRTIRR